MVQKLSVKYGVVVTTRIPVENAKRIDEIAARQDTTRALMLTRLLLKGLAIYEEEIKEKR